MTHATPSYFRNQMLEEAVKSLQFGIVCLMDAVCAGCASPAGWVHVAAVQKKRVSSNVSKGQDPRLMLNPV